MSRVISGIILGLLLGIWTFIAIRYAYPVWQVMIATGCFLATAGKLEGLWKVLVTLLSGILWIFLTMWVFTELGLGRYNIPVAIGVTTLIIYAQTALWFLSFIMAALCGAAIHFGTILRGDPWWHSILAVIVGPILGYLAELIGSFIIKRDQT